ncbi:protocatechuate 3,4-dioxygenase subunit alpha [Corynebacterium sp. p3-SID1056]|uniref:protocatechuate 3,4-dioxygenase subunit alpha n=1 Tax=Corynebacterium sp. p3-SID1056 TaxID=2916092 RepID=UPI0021A5AED2|nr:protocatechuate 3,4-dioxygenase subunit alpha [Corynebacterium sp. p3-SID1056]MCT2338234.1 protocatechuate 3,4-dioxygenase subunit alpha [Corynebacterium sp. p3-SID1056]
MRIDKNANGEFRYGDPSVQDQDEAEFGIMPSQTVGPYVHIGLTRDGSEILAAEEDGHKTIEVSVTAVDGNGDPIADAMFEIWQPNSEGLFNSEHDPRVGDAATAQGFRGLGRAFADESGTARFQTVVPGAIEAVSGFEAEAPHLKIGIFARGILERLYTRMYFPDFSDANETDPVLNQVDPSMRELLVAKATDKGYHLDIRVQDEDPLKETPFFHIVGEDTDR